MPEQSFVAGGLVPAPAARRSGWVAAETAVPVRFQALGRPQGAAESAAHDEARAAGFAAGYAAGAREAARVAQDEARRVAAEHAARQERDAQALSRALDVLDRAALAAQSRTDPVLEQAEATLHAAALELARAVLGVELADHEHAARAALARVLDHPRLPATVTVRLHPQDLDVLRSVGAVPQEPAVTLVADPALRRGDAVAEHPDGMLDARIGAALERARAVLEGERP